MNQSNQLRDAVRRLIVAHGTLDQTTRPCGTRLSTAHAWTLLELRDGPHTIGQLADRLFIDRTNVSRLCSKMQRDGEVELSTPPADRRARVVSLTNKGRRLANRVDEASSGHFEAVLSRLEQPEVVVRALQQLAGAIAATRHGDES